MTPTIPLATIQTTINQFVLAMAAAEDGGVQNTINKNVFRQVLSSYVSSNAQYVTMVCRIPGSNTYEQIRAGIAISGYVASKIPEPLSTLPQLEIQYCESTAIGLLQVRLGSQAGARAYIMRYKLSTETNWNTFVSTSSRFKLTGLLSSMIYDIQFVPKGSTNTTVTETDVIQCVIL